MPSITAPRKITVEEFLYYYTGLIKIQRENGTTFYFGYTGNIHNQDQVFLHLDVKYTTCCLHCEQNLKHCEYSSYLIIYV